VLSCRLADRKPEQRPKTLTGSLKRTHLPSLPFGNGTRMNSETSSQLPPRQAGGNSNGLKLEIRNSRQTRNQQVRGSNSRTCLRKPLRNQALSPFLQNLRDRRLQVGAETGLLLR
jgi:hypothetical protein